MALEWVRKHCLALPHATEQIQWGSDLVFKVGGKMFAVLALEPGPVCMSFKTAPERFAELIERPGVIPAPYLARAQWVALENTEALLRTEIEILLASAHGIVLSGLPKKLREELRSAEGGARAAGPAKGGRKRPSARRSQQDGLE